MGFYCGEENSNIEIRFSTDHRIVGFDTNDFNGDGNLEIIVFSNAVGRYPAQMCFLDHMGKRKGEYWNS